MISNPYVTASNVLLSEEQSLWNNITVNISFFIVIYMQLSVLLFLARLMEICSVDITTEMLLFGSNELDSDVNCQIFELVISYIFESGRFVI